MFKGTLALQTDKTSEWNLKKGADSGDMMNEIDNFEPFR